MKRLCVGLLLVGSLLGVGCGPRKLVVGVVLPETGVNSGYGTSLKAGIKLAMDDAIAKQSPKGLEARYRDSLSHPEYAEKEANELFKSGALIIVGGATSSEAKFIIPEAEKAKGVVISPSASEPGLAATSNLFFRIVPSDDVEALAAADFLAKQRNVKTILVLYQEGVYASGFLKYFTEEVTKVGAKIVGNLQIGPTDWDKPIAEALATGKPDAVFVCAYAEETLAALQVIRTAKYPGTVCLTSAFAAGSVVSRAGALADGVFVPMIDLDLSSQKEPMKSFVQRFKAANNGALPDLYAAYGYDAALAAIYALQGTPPEQTSELLQRLMSLGDKQGVTGKLAFDSSGDINRQVRIHCVKDGKFLDCDSSPRS